jgi:hypothetical protein
LPDLPIRNPATKPKPLAALPIWFPCNSFATKHTNQYVFHKLEGEKNMTGRNIPEAAHRIITGRRVLFTIGAVVTLMVAGSVYQMLASSGDALKFPAPGRLVATHVTLTTEEPEIVQRAVQSILSKIQMSI